MRFVNALRDCLGLAPLYNVGGSPDVEPPSYGAAFDDGNRRATRHSGCDNVNHSKNNRRESGARSARRVILGLGR